MCVLSLIYMFLEVVLYEMNLLGKIIFIPVTIAITLMCVPIILVEFVVVDVWVFLFVLFSRTVTFRDVKRFFF